MKPTSRLHGLSPAAAQSIIAAAQALEAGRPDDAARALAGVLASHPDHPEALRLEAGILDLRGQHAQAVAAMQRALAQRPDDALYHNTLGSVLADAGEFDAAIAALRRACELQPDLATAWYNLGIVLTRCVRYAEAAAALCRAVEIDPHHALARAQLADALKGAGRAAEAAAQYRKLVKESPSAGMAWWGLANIKTMPLGAADVDALRVALRDPRARDDDRIAMGFALARALDDRGDLAPALEALAQANAMARQRTRWDAVAFAAAIDAIGQAFATASSAGEVDLGRETIFVVGLPRSGTTLVEQILASHSQVQGAGELPDLPMLINAESARRGVAFPRWVSALAPADWASLGRQYLARTAHWREQRPRFIDKLPNNWIHIPAIRAMLPGARIVVCRRDALETCFSCYRQHFAGNDYTRSFSALAAYWRDFDRSVRAAAIRWPGRVFEHDYEKLIADPERGIRALLAFCDLPFEEGCLRFHETARAVHSPSAAQVREPLRADTAQAARYGALLDPLRAALGMVPFRNIDDVR
ncbi:MAG: sulfotransferase [Proteobacteria bacterium]|nr:sulfotransferase [Pseudomonadota bacterium]